MWPARREMNRDECRKYLRYLELDAYGSMVSVLRAQGPFTSEKQKLLQELARVLHISSERHRAEVRRAVNDEKLTQIAEQLGGPNTGTDWMIEGRRVIPLLPRLKARSAFTTLANSLSLATAAANDKKPLILDKIEQSKDIYESQVKVKVEESSSDTDEILPGDDESSNDRICLEQVSPLQPDLNRQSSNHDVVQLSIASRKRKSPSPLPTAPPHKVLVISSSSLENSNHCAENTARYLQTGNSSLDSEAANNHTTDTSTSIACTANALKSKLKPVVQNKLHTKVSHKLTGNSHSTSASIPKSSIQCVQTSEGKPGPKLAASNNSERVAAICPGTVVSSGPGPPQTCKKSSTFNLQTTAKTGANSKHVNIPQHPTKLGSKTNVIVIQKGHTKGVTFSHAGKEALGKVVMGGKNLSVTPQKMNNGDQTANIVSSRNSKSGSTIVFNLQDASEKKKVCQLLDSPGVLASEPKTVIHNTNARSLKEETNNDLCTIDEALDDEETLTGSSSEENERNDECENANSLDSIDSLGNAEIVIDTSQLTEDVSELELKQIVCSSEMELKELSGSEISLDNVQYLVEGSENYILEETRSPILISQNSIDNT